MAGLEEGDSKRGKEKKTYNDVFSSERKSLGPNLNFESWRCAFMCRYKKYYRSMWWLSGAIKI